MTEINTLHSHSQIELRLYMPKDRVLVDEKFGGMFGIYCNDKNLVTYDGVRYYAVPTRMFARLGGRFQR